MSTPLRALWLAWGAVVALLAYPAGAQIIGQQSGIMGGEAGFLRPVGAASDTLTLDAMPYARTVTCGSYTLTGTYTGSVPTWSASPSGASGSCSDTGGGTFSCVVSVAPDATGEGVETITVSNGATDTETIGFYVNGAHSCFLAQSVDGSYNSSLADLDPVATWENLGSSVLDVTQGTGTEQPTFRTSIVGGQPVVSCDGGDGLAAATAADWNFTAMSTAWSAGIVALQAEADPGGVIVIASTSATASTSGSAGMTIGVDDTSGTFNDRALFSIAGGAFARLRSDDDIFPPSVFHLFAVYSELLGGDDLFGYVDGASIGSVAKSSYGTVAARALTLCRSGGATGPMTGDLFRVLIYESALDATQRGINQAVDEWALGGTLPVTP